MSGELVDLDGLEEAARSSTPSETFVLTPEAMLVLIARVREAERQRDALAGAMRHIARCAGVPSFVPLLVHMSFAEAGIKLPAVKPEPADEPAPHGIVEEANVFYTPGGKPPLGWPEGGA